MTPISLANAFVAPAVRPSGQRAEQPQDQEPRAPGVRPAALFADSIITPIEHKDTVYTRQSAKLTPEMRHFLEERGEEIARKTAHLDLDARNIEITNGYLDGQRFMLKMLQDELSGASAHMNRLAGELNDFSNRFAKAAPEEKEMLRKAMDLTGTAIFEMQRHFAGLVVEAPAMMAGIRDEIARSEANLLRMYAERPDLAPADPANAAASQAA